MHFCYNFTGFHPVLQCIATDDVLILVLLCCCQLSKQYEALPEELMEASDEEANEADLPELSDKRPR